MNPVVSIFWFRRDLRLEDNAGLYHALKSGTPIPTLSDLGFKSTGEPFPPPVIDAGLLATTSNGAIMKRSLKNGVPGTPVTHWSTRECGN